MTNCVFVEIHPASKNSSRKLSHGRKMENINERKMSAEEVHANNAEFQKQRHKNLYAIQALRAVAALSVVAYHSSNAITTYRPNALSHAKEQFLSIGQAGVDIFFAISGFIIIFTTRHLFSQKKAASSFLLRRLVRIAPLYWILTSALLLMWLSGFALKEAHFTIDYIAKSFLLIPSYRTNFQSSTIHPILDQGWTLSYELYFYLVYAFFLRYSTPQLATACIPIIFSLILIWANFFLSTSALADFLKNPLIIEFGFGLAWGYIYSRGIRLTKYFAFAAVTAAIAAFVFSSSYIVHEAYRPFVWGLPSVALMAGLTSFSYRVEKSRIKNFITYVGDISYSLYLTHGFITLALGNALRKNIVPEIPFTILFCAAILSSLMVGALTYKIVERPTASFLHKRFKDRYKHLKD